MKRIQTGLQPRSALRTGVRGVPPLLVFLAGAMLCGAQVPAQKQPAAPAAPSKAKPVDKWNDADWKAYGTSLANDPAVQKLPPLDRAKYVADQVGQQYDAAGITPNNWYFGKGRQGFGGEAPGTCGDLTVNVESALQGAGFQTGNIEVEQEGVGYYNPFNVNRNHGAPVVMVDGKEYVFDLWFHSGSEGKFSGFKDSAFAMPMDDWKAQMKEEGYKVSTYAAPPPPPGTKPKSEMAESEGITGPGETSGQPPESATPPPNTGDQPKEGEGVSDDGKGGDIDKTATGDKDKSDQEPTTEKEPETQTPPEKTDGAAVTDADKPDDPEATETEPTTEDETGATTKPDSTSTGTVPGGDSENKPEGETEDEPEAAPEAGETVDNGDGSSTTTQGWVEGKDGSRITLTETQNPDGSTTSATTETDADGKITGQTTYEGGTGEGKDTTPGGGLKGAEPESDADVDSETVSSGVNTSGNFSDNWSNEQKQNTADSTLTMANNTQMTDAANVGNQQINDAKTTRDSGGRDAQTISDNSAKDTAKADQANSWGKAIGDAIETGITEGGKAFGTALGGAAADEVAGAIFGTSKPDSDSDGGDGKSADETQTGGTGQPSASGGGSNKGNRPTNDDEDEGEDDGSSSGEGCDEPCDTGSGGDATTTSSPSDDPLGVRGSTSNDDGTVTIRYGCGYSWTGTPPGPSRCPICARETVSTESNSSPSPDPIEPPDDTESEPAAPSPPVDAPDDGPLVLEGWSS